MVLRAHDDVNDDMQKDPVIFQEKNLLSTIDIRYTQDL